MCKAVRTAAEQFGCTCACGTDEDEKFSSTAAQEDRGSLIYRMISTNLSYGLLLFYFQSIFLERLEGLSFESSAP